MAVFSRQQKADSLGRALRLPILICLLASLADATAGTGGRSWIPAPIRRSYYGAYTVNTFVGDNHAQLPFRLLLNIGDPFTWVPGKGCINCNECHNFYDSDTSKHFEPDGRRFYEGNDMVDPCNWVKGAVNWDKFEVGELGQTVVAPRMQFGAVCDGRFWQFYGDDGDGSRSVDGVLGLGAGVFNAGLTAPEDCPGSPLAGCDDMNLGKQQSFGLDLTADDKMVEDSFMSQVLPNLPSGSEPIVGMHLLKTDFHNPGKLPIPVEGGELVFGGLDTTKFDEKTLAKHPVVVPQSGESSADPREQFMRWKLSLTKPPWVEVTHADPIPVPPPSHENEEGTKDAEQETPGKIINNLTAMDVRLNSVAFWLSMSAADATNFALKGLGAMQWGGCFLLYDDVTFNVHIPIATDDGSSKVYTLTEKDLTAPMTDEEFFLFAKDYPEIVDAAHVEKVRSGEAQPGFATLLVVIHEWSQLPESLGWILGTTFLTKYYTGLEYNFNDSSRGVVPESVSFAELLSPEEFEQKKLFSGTKGDHLHRVLVNVHHDVRSKRVDEISNRGAVV